MTEPHYADEAVSVYHGDCLDVLATLAADSVDAVVTDPPYGLEFMGKGWDAPWQERGINADAGFSAVGMADGFARLPRPSFTGSTNPTCRNCKGRRRGRRDGTALVPTCTCDAPDFPNHRAVEMRAYEAWCEQWAKECLRVLKPGGHLLAFGGTRTAHRLAAGIEDAGFELRDSIAWLYGSGFPKSLDVSKAIDKQAGAEREVVVGGSDGALRKPRAMAPGGAERLAVQTLSAPTTDDAKAWQGWGTALKPAHEPIVVARKSPVGTVAGNVLEYGTGALNIDGCRVGFASKADERESKNKNRHADFGTAPGGNEVYGDFSMVERTNYEASGRWPTNVVLDETQAEELDRQTANLKRQGNLSHGEPTRDGALSQVPNASSLPVCGYGDSGGASRFFPTFRYEAKAPTHERPRDGQVAHPTVKPLDLMRWLVRLVTPPGGAVLDPFLGSGTTAEACIIEGFRCIGIEREADYLPLILARITKPIAPVMFGMEAS